MRDKVIEIIARATFPLAWGTAWQKEALEKANNVLTALEAAGFAVVPVAPTESMVAHGGAAVDHPSVFMGGPSRGGKMTVERAYAAMLKAAKDEGNG